MKTAIIPYGISLVFLLSFMLGCVPSPKPSPEETARQFMSDQTEGLSENLDGGQKERVNITGQLPVRYQKPGYMLKRSTASGANGEIGELTLPVGADISTPAGPKPLGIILGQIVAMKNMGISYGTDVDQNAPVTVNVRADQDFFKAIENILRPLDFFYELDANTLIIKHKETRKYHVAMPFLNSIYTTGVGGNVLGSTEGTNMNGTLSIDSSGNSFDIWTNIQTNLDKILEIWTEAPATRAAASADTEGTSEANTVGNDEGSSAPATAIITQQAPGKGYYTIDKPIGLISVTAPRSLQAKIDDYITNLKYELYKQISIEVKMVEVELTENDTTGLNWTNLLGGEKNLGFSVDFGKIDHLYLADRGGSRVLTLAGLNFDVAIDAMKQQGNVEVLSNPRLTVMNGQPAMISVGENRTYVDEITESNNEGVITVTTSTASVMSGLGFGIIASIVENNEIILSITPVTTDLQLDSNGDIHSVDIGDNTIGLPRIKVKEMQTIVRVKDGEMLIVGGLIDQTSSYNNNKVAGLGNLPIAGKLFRNDGTNNIKKELVILLRPKIISMQ